MFKLSAKAKPKWHQFRWRISSWLVRLAQKIYPKNPDVTAFYTQVMVDQAIYGKSVVRINPDATWKDN